MGKEDAELYYFAADGGDLDYYFIAGETMRDILGAYTGLTGRTALPQKRRDCGGPGAHSRFM